MASGGKTHILARPGDPCVMVIFGASGDLTKRKLVPALYNLAKDGLLAQEFALVGYARAGMSSEQFRARLGEEMRQFATTEVASTADEFQDGSTWRVRAWPD
jgi:glucose-6-phosphate 1-dehydrogenase